MVLVGIFHEQASAQAVHLKTLQLQCHILCCLVVGGACVCVLCVCAVYVCCVRGNVGNSICLVTVIGRRRSGISDVTRLL